MLCGDWQVTMNTDPSDTGLPSVGTGGMGCHHRAIFCFLKIGKGKIRKDVRNILISVSSIRAQNNYFKQIKKTTNLNLPTK